MVLDKKLHLYSIMPLDMAHFEEICADIKEQYENGVCTCPLFKMTLVPEGNPPVNKAKILCEQYMRFKERLDKMGIPNGILVQASIGHGWVLSEMFPYEQFTNFRTGEKERIVCPYDEGFRQYIADAFKTIGACRPHTVMLDDDFRLMSHRSGGACGCSLHIKEFNKRAGTSLTREKLYNAVKEDSDTGRKYSEIFIETQREALIDCAKIMRRALDETDPTLPCSFCCVGTEAECAAEIAEILAGKGNPKIVRINNGNYCNPQIKFITNCFCSAAQQIAKLGDKVDIILAETDTCPQNRYSSSASVLHTHFTGTLLEGAKGAKQWITRLAAFEPESGKAYRKVLAKYEGFYEKLAEMVPTLKWRGCRSPLYGKPAFAFGKTPPNGFNSWICCVLERFGLPVYFSADNGGILCLEGDLDERISDEELEKALSKTVFLSSDSAQRLIKRGFGELLGIDVRSWQGKQPSFELLNVNKNNCSVQKNYKELVPLNEGVYADSQVVHGIQGTSYEELFPGTTVYKNKKGGTAVVFCGTPDTHYNIVEAFSFLNYSRKQQLIRLMAIAGELPIYCPGDEEIYLKAADMPDGKLFCAITNIGFDEAENIEIICERKVNEIERLTPNGTFEKVAFTAEGEKTVLEISAKTLEPVILIIK